LRRQLDGEPSFEATLDLAMTLSRGKFGVSRWGAPFAFGLLAFFSSSCRVADSNAATESKPAKEASESARAPVVFTVGSTDVRLDEAQAQIQHLPPQALSACRASPEQTRACVERLVDSEALAQEARRLGYHRHPDVVAAEKRAMVRNMLSDRTSGVAPTDAEIERHYQEHQADFSHPELARVVEIIVGSREQARTVWKIARGKSLDEFRELVSRYSESPAARDTGGNLSLVVGNADDPLRPLAVAAFALKNPGDLAPVVELPDGFHVVMLRERVAPGIRPLAEARSRIIRFLSDQKRTKLQDELLASSRASAKVTIFDKELGGLRWAPRAPDDVRLARPEGASVKAQPSTARRQLAEARE
jgi:hypothetical protein